MSKRSSLLPQVSKFALVGVINTLIDFVILNVFNLVFGVPKIPSNIISTTTAMTFSFFANRRFVFDSESKRRVRQAILFVVITLTGLWGLQTLIFWLLDDVWRWPIELAITLFDGFLPAEFIETNGIKAVATVATMVWNFVLYKKVVFKDESR